MSLSSLPPSGHDEEHVWVGLPVLGDHRRDARPGNGAAHSGGPRAKLRVAGDRALCETGQRGAAGECAGAHAAVRGGAVAGGWLYGNRLMKTDYSCRVTDYPSSHFAALHQDSCCQSAEQYYGFPSYKPLGGSGPEPLLMSQVPLHR